MDLVEEKENRKDEKLFNFRPVFFGAFFFALGILFYFYHKFNGLSAGWLWLLTALAGLPFFFCKGKDELVRLLFKIGILGACFFLGIASLLTQTANFQRMEIISGEYFVSGVVAEKSLGNEKAVVVLKDVSPLENISLSGKQTLP